MVGFGEQLRSARESNGLTQKALAIYPTPVIIDGISKVNPLDIFIVTGVGYIASAVFLSIALRQLPLGTAYAMWTGMGIMGTTLLGIFLFNEKLSVPQVICVILIVVGIAGLKLLAKD